MDGDGGEAVRGGLPPNLQRQSASPFALDSIPHGQGAKVDDSELHDEFSLIPLINKFTPFPVCGPGEQRPVDSRLDRFDDKQSVPLLPDYADRGQLPRLVPVRGGRQGEGSSRRSFAVSHGNDLRRRRWWLQKGELDDLMESVSVRFVLSYNNNPHLYSVDCNNIIRLPFKFPVRTLHDLMTFHNKSGTLDS